MKSAPRRCRQTSCVTSPELWIFVGKRDHLRSQGDTLRCIVQEACHPVRQAVLLDDRMEHFLPWSAGAREATLNIFLALMDSFSFALGAGQAVQ